MSIYNDEISSIEHLKDNGGLEGAFWNVACALLAVARELEQANDMKMIEMKQNPKLYRDLQSFGLGWKGGIDDFPNGDKADGGL